MKHFKYTSRPVPVGLLLLLLLLTSFIALGQSHKRPAYASAAHYNKFRIVRQGTSARRLSLPFVELRGGAAAWNYLDQSDFKATAPPLFGSLTFGKIFSPISVGAGYSARTNAEFHTYRLENSYIFGFLQLQVLQAITSEPSPLEIYLMGGINNWKSALSYPADGTNDGSPIIEERKSGIGSFAGLGILYRFRNLGLGAEYQWFLGEGQYTGGADVPSTLLTGSGQLMVTASIRFVWGGKTVQCPIYSK